MSANESDLSLRRRVCDSISQDCHNFWRKSTIRCITFVNALFFYEVVNTTGKQLSPLGASSRGVNSFLKSRMSWMIFTMSVILFLIWIKWFEKNVWENLTFMLKELQFVMSLKIWLSMADTVCHVTVTTMMSYWCLSDVYEIKFCQGTKHTSLVFHTVAIVTYRGCLLTYNLSVCHAPLKLYEKLLKFIQLRSVSFLYL